MYTWIDYLIIGITVLSILAGLKRGFLKEVISLATIIAAFFVAITFSGSLADWFDSSAGAQSVVSSLARVFGEANVEDALSLITLGLSFFVLFLLTIIVGEMINRVASGASIIPGLGMINHLLGAAFGAIRGFLITVVILFLLNLTAVPQSNAWIQSQLLSHFQPSIVWLSNIVKPGLQIVKDKVGKALENRGRQSKSSVYNGTAS